MRSEQTFHERSMDGKYSHRGARCKSRGSTNQNHSETPRPAVDKTRHWTAPSAGKAVDVQVPSGTAGGSANGVIALETPGNLLKSQVHLLSNVTIPLVRIYPWVMNTKVKNEWKRLIHTLNVTIYHGFIIIASNWKLNILQLQKAAHVHLYSLIQRNKQLIYVTTWLHLKCVILSNRTALGASSSHL
jgi:hypothetical protein